MATSCWPSFALPVMITDPVGTSLTLETLMIVVSTETLLLPESAVTMSILPSPLTSANATDTGLFAPTSNTCGALKPPPPSLINIATSLSL